MVTIVSETLIEGYAPRWHFKCTECNRTINFYSIAQRQCPECLAHLPFIPGNLLRKKAARVEYHVKAD